MYALIGKQVNGLEIVKYRFLSPDTEEYIDILSEELPAFMQSHEVSNVKWVNNSLEFKWQDLLSLPNFREDGSVSTYNLKVIVDASGHRTWRVANILGCVISVSVNNMMHLLMVSKLHSIIINTEDRVVKFSMNLDGTYTSTKLDPEDFSKTDYMANYDTYTLNCGIDPINMDVFTYKNELCQYAYKKDVYGSAPRRCIGSFGLNKISTIRLKGNGYHLGSYTGRELFNDPNACKFKLSSLDYIVVGIDGLTVLTNRSVDLNPSLTKDLYERMLALDPDNAKKLKKFLHIGMNKDVLHCNLAYCDIPDGAETVGDYSLSFEFCKEDKKSPFDDESNFKEQDFNIVIPESVTKFSGKALNSLRFGSDITKKVSLHVQNLAIVRNVVDSVIGSGGAFKSIVVNGDSVIDGNYVRRLYQNAYRFDYISNNLEIHLYARKDLGEYSRSIMDFQVKPYSVKYGRVLYVNSQEDFDKIYVDWQKKLEKRYRVFKALMKDLPEKLQKGNKRVLLREAKSFGQNLDKDYHVLSDMLMNTSIKEGDAEKYKSMVDSVYKHRRNLFDMVNKELLYYEARLV